MSDEWKDIVTAPKCEACGGTGRFKGIFSSDPDWPPCPRCGHLLKMPRGPDWYMRKAALEGDHEIGAGSRSAWQTMATAPKDGTHILAVLYREAINDMDDIRRPAFGEIREIWYRPYQTLGMELPWHAGDPFDSHDGMAPDHMGEDVPVLWMPLPKWRLPS